MKFDTKCVRAAIEPDPTTGSIIPPIYQSATFGLPEIGKDRGFDYTRSSNPTRQVLEEQMAALGACTNMTLRMYANRKKSPLEGVESRLKHAKIHARDCEDCQSETGKIDVIEKELTVHGPLSEEQRARLLEIAGRCPVHRTMTSETVIRSRLVD